MVIGKLYSKNRMMRTKRLNTKFNIYLLDNLKNYSEVFEAKFLDCRSSLSEVNVHDLRVSMRRMMAFTNLIYNVYSDCYTKSVSKELKKILKALNPLRDIQVQILALEQNLEATPFLSNYFQYLKLKEDSLIAEIKLLLTEKFINTIEGLILFIRMELRNKLKQEHFDIHSFYEKTFESFNLVLERSKQIIPEDINTIHFLRLAFKKYRYTIEVMKPYSGMSNKTMRKMKKIQDILGAIQDNNVQFELIDAYIKSIDETSSIIYSPFITIILSRRKKMVSSLMSKIHTIEQVQFRLPASKTSASSQQSHSQV